MVLGRLSQDAFIVGGNREYGARLFQRLQQQADQSGKINWELHFIDGSVIRAHQHAAGAIRGEVEPNSELSAVEQVHYS